MKNELLTLFETSGQLGVQEVITNIIMSAILGCFIFMTYAFSHRGTIYSKKFNASLVMLAVLTGTVMTVIGNNVALSLGMVGALSVVRFRTAIKDSRDTVYIFWTIIVGICCGVGDYMVAAVGSAVTFVTILLMGLIKNDNRMLLIIRASYNRQEVIQAYIFKTFHKKAVLRVRNTTSTTVEFIYEISSKLLEKVESENNNLMNGIYALGGIEYVNIVMQNDEISN